MASLTKIKTIRAGHRGATTKLFRRADSMDNFTEEEFDSIVETLKEKQSILAELNSQVLNATSDADIAEEIEETDKWTIEFKSKLIKLTKQAKRSSEISLNPNAPVFVQSMNQNQSNISLSQSFHKLPKISLPKFDGNIIKWQSFWDSFESAVHNNETLSNVQKFNYLKSQLQHEAVDCIEGLQITNANYMQAVHLLSERFGQAHKIKNVYMQNLLELPPPTSKISSLKQFYDKLESYIRGLEALGHHENDYDSLLIPVLQSKLPSEVRKNLTRENGSDEWTLSKLRCAIRKEIQIQESGEHFYSTSSVSDEHLATAAFHAGTSQRTNNPRQVKQQSITLKPCVFCAEIHPPTKCTKVADITERKSIIVRDKLCFNCLGKHKISACKSKGTCKLCDKRHHTSICDSKQPKCETKTEKADTRQYLAKRENVAITHSVNVFTPSQVLLKTAVADVSAKNGIISSANILLDEGAQRSFITEQLAQKLNLCSQNTEKITIAGFGEHNHSVRNLKSDNVLLYTDDGKNIEMNVLIVPQIASPIQNYTRSVRHISHLKNLKLANPYTGDEMFEVEMLIGADYYWDVVEDKIIRGDGPTAMK